VAVILLVLFETLPLNNVQIPLKLVWQLPVPVYPPLHVITTFAPATGSSTESCRVMRTCACHVFPLLREKPPRSPTWKLVLPPGVGVAVHVAVGVGEGVGLFTGVLVGVGLGPVVAVGLGVGVFVAVRVGVGVSAADAEP